MPTESPRLPDFLVADLYRNSLVLVEEELNIAIETNSRSSEVVAAPEITTPVRKPIIPVQPVISPVKTTIQPANEPPALTGEWYLGTNQKKITIVVNEPEAKYLKDDSFQFLSAILGACKLNMGDVAIVNYAHYPVTYTQLKEKLSPTSLLLFDVSAKQVHLPFTVPFYQVQKYDSCQLLMAPTLETMLGTGQDAKLEKSKLWLCLKKIFGI